MSNKSKCAINMTLFKIIGFQEMIDPYSSKIFGYNTFNLINVLLIILTSTLTTIGLSGYFYKTNDKIIFGFQDMQMTFYLACITVGNLKLSIIIYNSNTIFELFDVAHDSFFSNEYCKTQFYKLVNCGKSFSKIFPWYFFLFFMTAFTWVTMPLVLNQEPTKDNENIRIVNVVNLRYPIAVETYNSFYKGLYIMEALMCSYGAFGLVVFDVFLIAFLKIISTQYEIISCAYENLEFKARNEAGGQFNFETIYKEFLSITSDSQELYKRLKTIYRISRPIILIYMVGDSIGMITMPYLIVMSYTQNGSLIFNTELLTFLWTLSVAGIQSYILCSLLQLVNEKKESVNYGIYSCNWTQSDIRIKKLILLTMRVNNSNDLKMNVTPTKCIDLPILAAIVRSSYSITSVLINSNL